MKKHRFTLVLADVNELTPELADQLFEATQGEIECSARDGVVYVEFERTAGALREAITAAITQVEGIDLGVRVLRVESEIANTIAQINAALPGAATR